MHCSNNDSLMAQVPTLNAIDIRTLALTDGVRQKRRRASRMSCRIDMNVKFYVKSEPLWLDRMFPQS